VTSLPLAAYFRSIEPYRYALQNSVVWPFGARFTLPGVFEHAAVPHAVNGPVWTLPWELNMYAILALLGALAFSRARTLGDAGLRRVLVALGLLGIAGYTLNDALGLTSAFRVVQALRFGALFFTGAACFVLRERVPLSAWLVLGAGVLLAGTFALGHPLMAIYVGGVSYLTLYLAHVPAGPIRRFNALGDYSYGLYLFAFPIQQVIAERVPGVSMMQLFCLAAPITLAFAVASWHLMEKPILALKQRGAA
jgi:peptidoglycan/LPS O-acetylase OafA/YrhL